MICYSAWKEVEETILDEKNIFPGQCALKLKYFAPVGDLALEYPEADLDEKIGLQCRHLAEYCKETRNDMKGP